jgi:hypothetical protein
MSGNNQIYRISPKGYNQNQDYYDRRETIYNPDPIKNLRIGDAYYSIKKELSAFELIAITKKLVSTIDYFTYENKIYKINDIPMETLYKDTSNKLISNEKLFSSTQKTFLDEHVEETLLKVESEIQKMRAEEEAINKNRDTVVNTGFATTLTPSPDLAPVSGSYFVSRSPNSYGPREIKINNVLLDHKKILQMMFYHFILKFNIETKKSNYDLPYHPWTNFFISDYQLIRIKYNRTLNLYYYTFIVEIFRNNKHNGYSIYLDMYFRAEKTQIWISKAILIGTLMQDELTFKDLNYYNYNNYQKKKAMSSYSNLNEKDSVLDNTYEKMKEFEYRNDNTKSVSYDVFTRDFDLQAGHKCFKPYDESYPDSKTSNACLSVDPNLRKTGVWDKECTRNDECPFFKANKNYPNNFGGCIDGFCQLPVGMTKIGYKHYGKEKPLCYNCNLKTEVMTADGTIKIEDRQCSGVECNKCCDIQHDRKIYPNLKSPDFVFDGDQTERERYSNLLNVNGIGVNKLIM